MIGIVFVPLSYFIKFYSLQIMSKKIRLLHFCIDTAIYLVLTYAFLVFTRGFIKMESAKWVSMVIYFLYYFLFEFFAGQTPGKMVTKYKVKKLSNEGEYWALQIAVRSLTRFIPLDIISYIFWVRGFHDWISKTTIVRI